MLEGYVHPDFTEVARVLRRQIPGLRKSFAPGGAAVCVYHRGEVVVDCWGGTRDVEGDPWEWNTMALSYSTTKGVASTLLHMLADRGLVDYDAPVREYWPEFAEGGKESITVRQVLCHEAGLFHIRDMVDDARRMLDWDYMVSALAEAEPCHTPGASHGYHAFTFGWLVGEIVQRITGKPFGEVLEAEIAGPLELDGLYVGVPAEEMHRRAQLIPVRGGKGMPDGIRALGRTLNQALRFARVPIDLDHMRSALMPRGIEDFDFGSEEVARATIPAANGIFTARSLARMYASIAGRGEIDGVRLLSAKTVDRMRAVQNRGMGRVVPYPMHWRLGYHRVHLMRGRVRGGLGHFGFGGSGAWADPERNLSAAMVLNSGAGSPFGDVRIVRLSTAIVRSADRR